MTLKTFTIEVRADFDEQGKHDILLACARDAARTLLTTAMMMQERRKPMVALQSSDFFYGNDDLSIDEDAQP
jgi:hypothetical protein